MAKLTFPKTKISKARKSFDSRGIKRPKGMPKNPTPHGLINHGKRSHGSSKKMM